MKLYRVFSFTGQGTLPVLKRRYGDRCGECKAAIGENGFALRGESGPLYCSEACTRAHFDKIRDPNGPKLLIDEEA